MIAAALAASPLAAPLTPSEAATGTATSFALVLDMVGAPTGEKEADASPESAAEEPSKEAAPLSFDEAALSDALASGIAAVLALATKPAANTAPAPASATPTSNLAPAIAAAPQPAKAESIATLVQTALGKLPETARSPAELVPTANVADLPTKDVGVVPNAPPPPADPALIPTVPPSAPQPGKVASIITMIKTTLGKLPDMAESLAAPVVATANLPDMPAKDASGLPDPLVAAVALPQPALDPAVIPAAPPSALPPTLSADASLSQSQPIAPNAAIQHQLDLAHDGAWLDRLARDIARTAAHDSQLRFQLNPEHLGSLHVELAHGADGTAIRLTTDTEAARAILVDAQPRLLAEARAQGLRISEAQIDLGGQGGNPRRQAEDQQPFIRTTAIAAAEQAIESPRPAAERYA